jgi:hypothetical protein
MPKTTGRATTEVLVKFRLYETELRALNSYLGKEGPATRAAASLLLKSLAEADLQEIVQDYINGLEKK